MPGLFYRWRRTVDASGLPGLVRTPTDDPRLIPAPPPGIKATDAELIASLQRELAARDTTIARLQEQLLKPIPALPAGDRWCPNCHGLEQTIALLREERGELRRKLIRYQLAATRPVTTLPET